MENLEGKILDVLNDPDKMAEILSLAQGLGLGPPPGEESPKEQSDGEGLPLAAILGLLQQMEGGDNRQECLLRALTPYLDGHRQKKLQKAIKIGKLSHLAGYALKNYAQQEQ